MPSDSIEFVNQTPSEKDQFAHPNILSYQVESTAKDDFN